MQKLCESKLHADIWKCFFFVWVRLFCMYGYNEANFDINNALNDVCKAVYISKIAMVQSILPMVHMCVITFETNRFLISNFEQE